MGRPSLKRRISLVTFGVLVLGLAGLSVGFNVLLRNRLHADATAVLKTRAEAQLAGVEISGGHVRLGEGGRDAALDREAWVFDGTIAIEKPNNPSAPVEAAVTGLAGVTHRTNRTVGNIRLLAVPLRRDGANGTVVAGVSLVPYQHTERIALVGSIVLSVFLLLAAIAAVRWSVAQALRPVAQMTRHAAEWSERDQQRRFDLGEPRDELTLLAKTFDDLLRRIEGALRREQRFSAELAHELRTPLTGMRAEAELALQRADLSPAAREGFERVITNTNRMATVIETLLSSAKAEGGKVKTASDPVPAVRDVLAVVEPSAHSRGVEIALDARDQQVRVGTSGDMVGQAIHPLVENAIRHARTRVAVTMTRDNGTVALAVCDDGPGLAGNDGESLFVPGVSGTGNAGLGLPLARRLARSCGGDVVAVPDAHGGRFELRLPAA
jgi:signal transduction histidine kinase